MKQQIIHVQFVTIICFMFMGCDDSKSTPKLNATKQKKVAPKMDAKKQEIKSTNASEAYMFAVPPTWHRLAPETINKEADMVIQSPDRRVTLMILLDKSHYADESSDSMNKLRQQGMQLLRRGVQSFKIQQQFETTLGTQKALGAMAFMTNKEGTFSYHLTYSIYGQWQAQIIGFANKKHENDLNQSVKMARSTFKWKP